MSGYATTPFTVSLKGDGRQSLYFLWLPPLGAFWRYQLHLEIIDMKNVDPSRIRSRTLARFSEMLDYAPAQPSDTGADRPAPQLARKGRARTGLLSV
jgi:hypothetical protein